MVTATGSALASKSRPVGRGVVSDKFNQGYATFHQEEIEVGKMLADAALLSHGRKECLRMLKSDPAALFEAFHYGRRIVRGKKAPGGGWLMPSSGGDLAMGKASNGHIFVPGKDGARSVLRRLRQLCDMPRWADGLTATAEALDDAGFAIAESIAALILFDITSDELFLYHGQKKLTGSIFFCRQTKADGTKRARS